MKTNLAEVVVGDIVVVNAESYRLLQVTREWKTKFEVAGRQWNRSTGMLVGASQWSKARVYAPLDTIGRDGKTYLSLVPVK